MQNRPESQIGRAPLRVYMPRQMRGAVGEWLPDALPAAEISLAVGEDRRPSPADWHVLVEGRPDESTLCASPNLTDLVVPYAGVPSATRRAVRELRPNVRVRNLHHNAAPTAEMALTLLLAAAKRVVPCDAALRRGDWRVRYDEDDTPLLAGRTAVVLGFGHVGRRLARALAALDVTVIAVRRRPAPEPVRDEATGALVVGTEALDDCLPRAELLAITLPETDATTNLLGAEQLTLLPAGAVLVNVGRGPIVDEAALFDALRTGRLGAAGLDVWYRYPPAMDESARRNTAPSAFPFGDLPNVVMSPHRAGHGAATERLRAQHLATLLRAIAAGDEGAGRVDLAHGY